MQPIVETCLSSDVDSGSFRVCDDVAFRERRCLEHCGICRVRPFAVVDGALVVEPELSAAMESLGVEQEGHR
jgi:uncharacterized protein YuzB (UPF0349 family)